MFFTFQKQKLEEVFIRYMSAKQLAKRGRCKLQAPIKGRNFGAKLAHFCGFLIARFIFSHAQEHRSRFWKLRHNFPVSVSQVRVLKYIYSPLNGASMKDR